MTVNQTLADEAVAHAVSLQQYSAGVVRKIIAQLNRTDSELATALQAALERLPNDSFTVERLELLLGQVRAINAGAYKQVASTLQAELEGLAAHEAAYQAAVLEAALPAPVLVRLPIVSVSAEQIYAATMARPFQGRLLRDWAATVEAGRMEQIRNAVRTGYLEGKSVADIVRGVRGSRVNQYADGFLQRSRQDLATIIRSAVSHTAATARNAIVDANGDIIKAVRWVSTLDTKTSAQCRERDQLQYTAEHKPIGRKVPWLDGPGKIHFHCRSTDGPVTKSWQELGIPVDELTAAQRASMDGQVPGGMTYGEWIKRQSPARQVEVLGVERAGMMREGASMDDFYSPSGKWLTLEELGVRSARDVATLAA